MERDRIIPNFSRRLKVRKYKEPYMFGRIGGGANFHMESGVGGGGERDNVPREEVRHQITV